MPSDPPPDRNPTKVALISGASRRFMCGMWSLLPPLRGGLRRAPAGLRRPTARLLFALVSGAGAPAQAGADQTGPDFDPLTGFRIAHYRAPVPDAAPGAETVALDGLRRLVDGGALLLDVVGVQAFALREDGSWITGEKRESLPGAVWLPAVGWGRLDPWQEAYLADSLARLTSGDRDAPIVVFCRVDCWLSWNAAQRIAALGYGRVAWFRDGAEAWAAAGLPLVPVEPAPVTGPRPD